MRILHLSSIGLLSIASEQQYYAELVYEIKKDVSAHDNALAREPEVLSKWHIPEDEEI